MWPTRAQFVSRIDETGVEWLAPLEDRDGSLFATVIDPDGNYVQIIQMEQRWEAAMFGDTKVLSSFAVDDIDSARRFYGETLGLKVTDAHETGLIMLHSREGGDVLVYSKPDHTPATFTVLNFFVEDIDAAVDELGRRGISFERYEGFEQDDKGIARSPSADEGPPVAWFTDPAGNILAVLEGE